MSSRPFSLFFSFQDQEIFSRWMATVEAMHVKRLSGWKWLVGVSRRAEEGGEWTGS